MTDHQPPYEDRDVRAVMSVFIELGQVLGSYIADFVVVGGAVPWLLLPDAIPPHVGTLDIDLLLDPQALGEGRYANLVEALEAADYDREIDSLKPFQLQRMVKVDAGDPVAVVVDLLMPKGAKLGKRKPKLLLEFRVQEADGGGAALQKHVDCPLEGEMPDGRHNSVSLRVASIPALLVMKGYALMGRSKDKDAYDIYFSLKNHPGGLDDLAEECQPLLDIPEFAVGLKNIASKFRNAKDFGPQTVRKFCEEANALGDLTSDQIQQDAYGQVNALMKRLKLA